MRLYLCACVAALTIGVVGGCGDNDAGEDCNTNDLVCPSCGHGEIESRCDCGGSVYGSGYCCTGTWQSVECGSSPPQGCPNPYPEGMLLCYGFEDWTGDADTTDGYPFGEYDEVRWAEHLEHTEVLSACGSWHPYEGSYFLYGNCHDANDDCLQNSGGSRRMYLGSDFAEGNNADFLLDESLLGDELYLKFRVLLGDGWKTNTEAPVKFVRTRWLSGAMGDSSSNVIQYDGEGNWLSAPGFGESAWIDLFHLDDIGIDLSDGQWHDFAMLLNLSSVRAASPGPLHVSVWIDDNLIIERDAAVDVDYVLSHTPVQFYVISFLSNFWGTEVTGSVPFAFDNIEVWDRVPASSSP